MSLLDIGRWARYRRYMDGGLGTVRLNHTWNRDARGFCVRKPDGFSIFK
jgi:hypothetical protein